MNIQRKNRERKNLMNFNGISKNFKAIAVEQNSTYQHYQEIGQAKTIKAKMFYLLSYLLPGIAAYILLNIPYVYYGLSNFFGLKGYDFQYYTFVIFTLGWHIAFPIIMLRKHDKLKWNEIPKFLSLDKFSLKEVLLVAPMAFAVSVIFSLPYMLSIYEPFQTWLNSLPGFQIPAYSIFASYEAFYGAPIFVLILMMIGNFIGEEIYFRGYLMKKTAFLGKYNWFVSSVLFCIYHLWQIPQTFPLIVPFLFFGLTMQLRKNLYTLIAFHLLFNIAGVQIYHIILSLGSGH